MTNSASDDSSWEDQCNSLANNLRESREEYEDEDDLADKIYTCAYNSTDLFSRWVFFNVANSNLNETQREYKSVRTEALPEELGISAKTRRSTKEPYFVWI